MKAFPYKVIDLTHTLSKEVCTWDGSCGFNATIKSDYQQSTSSVKFRTHQISMHAGVGTHMDAPVHCFADGKTIAEIELHHLITPCIKIDVSAKAQEGYTVSEADLINFEEQHGQIQASSFVIIHTGWDRFWHNPEQYKSNYRYPSISKIVAELLVERNVVGLGIDTLSPDRPQDDYPVHHVMLGAGKYIVENVANATQVPATSAFSLVMPIKIENGTEAPIRLVALLAK